MLIYGLLFLGVLLYLVGLWHFTGWLIETLDRRQEIKRAETRVDREQARGELRARTTLYAVPDSNVIWLPGRNDTRPAA